MPTYIDRKGRITAQVWIKPMPRQSRTFGSMDDARAWAEEIEETLKEARASGIHYLAVKDVGKKPNTKAEVNAMPRVSAEASVVGIYFLYHEGECVYVGQSRQIPTRVQEHRVRARHLKAFDSYSWITCDVQELDSLERYYIDLMKPALNTVGSPNFSAIQMVGAAKRRGKVLQKAVADQIVRKKINRNNLLHSL